MTETTHRPRIYISGPITQGNRNWNFWQAAETERQLMLSGFAPLNPMRSMVMPFAWEDDMPHELWIACDLPWVECADAVLRLEGISAGADSEVEYAKDCGIMVFDDLDELEQWFFPKPGVNGAPLRRMS